MAKGENLHNLVEVGINILCTETEMKPRTQYACRLNKQRDVKGRLVVLIGK